MESGEHTHLLGLRQWVFWRTEILSVCMLSMGVKSIQLEEASREVVRSASTSEAASQRFEHYEVLVSEDGKPIEFGRGAMGITYKAFDVLLHCPVTLKVISERYLGDESARVRFCARRVRQPAFVIRTLPPYYAWAELESSYFYAMEFVEGRNT